MITLPRLSGCVNTESFHNGTFKGEPYELAYRETKGFSTNSIYYEVKLGRRKWVKVDPNTTNWGPPYADDLYGDARRVYINKNHTPYSNDPDNAVIHPSTMLYLSPSRFSQDTFDQYAAFMQSEWPKIDHQFGVQSRFPHIIGLVYGEQDDFARTFRGQKDRIDYIIRVEVDGRIRYGSPTLSFEQSSGLSEKVQMPGKVIHVATGKDAGLSLIDLQNYRDAGGKTLSDYFTLTEKR